MRGIIVVTLEKYHLSQMVTDTAHQRELERNCSELGGKGVRMLAVSCFKARWVQAK